MSQQLLKSISSLLSSSAHPGQHQHTHVSFALCADATTTSFVEAALRNHHFALDDASADHVALFTSSSSTVGVISISVNDATPSVPIETAAILTLASDMMMMQTETTGSCSCRVVYCASPLSASIKSVTSSLAQLLHNIVFASAESDTKKQQLVEMEEVCVVDEGDVPQSLLVPSSSSSSSSSSSKVVHFAQLGNALSSLVDFILPLPQPPLNISFRLSSDLGHAFCIDAVVVSKEQRDLDASLASPNQLGRVAQSQRKSPNSPLSQIALSSAESDIDYAMRCVVDAVAVSTPLAEAFAHEVSAAFSQLTQEIGGGERQERGSSSQRAVLFDVCDRVRRRIQERVVPNVARSLVLRQKADKMLRAVSSLIEDVQIVNS